MNTANPTPPSEVQRRDEISKISALANVPIVISVIAVYAFFLSSAYVASLTEAFRFPIANYLTSIGYVQFIPQTLVIRNGAYGYLLIFSIPLMCIILIRQIFQLRKPQPADQAKPWQPRWLFEFIARVKARLGISDMTGYEAWALLKIVFWSWAALLLWGLAWDTYWNAGNLVKEYLRQKGRLYTIYLKGAQTHIEGKLFLQSSVYLLVLRDQDNSIIAIPETEVSLITAPLQFPSPTPSGASPATPSPTSSTPK
jgi:hypothetical protein